MEEQKPAWHRREDLFLVPPGGWVLIAMLMLAVGLGGGRPLWAQGLLTLGIGILWLVWPPQKWPGRWLFWTLALLAAVPLLAYLPEAFFAESLWRTKMAEMPAIGSSGFVTPQPWLTFHVWLLWLAGVALVGWCTTQAWDQYHRHALAVMFVAGFSGITAFALFAYASGNNPTLWESSHGFGPFANRNQWGAAMGLAGIMSLALIHRSVRHKEKRNVILWVLCLALLLSAIVLNGSRGGLLTLVAGGFAYLMFFGLLRKEYRYASISISFLLICFALFSFGGGPLLERFVSLRDTFESGGEGDFRLQFYRMTRTMISDAPLTGVGLGNFEFVLPFYLDFEAVYDRRPVHPESSFLWLASEGGWLAVGAVVAAFGLLGTMAYRARRAHATTIRSGGLACALMLVAGSFFDVSGHRLGTLFPTIFLAALAFPDTTGRPLGRKARASLRLVGAGVLAVGVIWFAASFGKPFLPAVQGVTALREAAGTAEQQGKRDEAIKLLRQAEHLRPLDWSIHWSLAAFLLANKETEAAWDEFRASSALLPYMHWIIEKEGYFWVSVSPSRAVYAWMEALNRAPGGQRLQMYGGYLHTASNDPALNTLVQKIRPNDPEFEFTRMSFAGEKGANRLPRLLAMTKNLSIAPDQLVDPILRYMHTFHQGDTIDRLTAQSQRLRQLGWRVLADRAAQAGRLGEALDLHFQYGPRPILPAALSRSDLRTIERTAALAPLDIATAIAYYQALEAERRGNDAFFQLRRIMEIPGAPPYVWHLAARAAHQRGENEDACKFLRIYNEKTKP
jgi:hypothetical protein